MAWPVFQGAGAGFHTAAVHGRDTLPQVCVGDHAQDSIRTDDGVRRDRKRDRSAERDWADVGARSRQRSQSQSDLDHHTVPQGCRGKRQSDGLCGRHRQKGAPPDTRAGRSVKAFCSDERDGTVGAHFFRKSLNSFSSFFVVSERQLNSVLRIAPSNAYKCTRQSWG